MVTRPSGVVGVCIIAMVLGGMGLFGALAMLPGLIMGGDFQEQMAAMGGMGLNAEQKAAQQQMMQGVAAVQKSWSVFLWLGTVAGFAGAVALLVGGIRAMKPNPSACRLFRQVLLAVALVDVARSVITSIVQYETQQVTGEFMAASMGGSSAGLGDFAEMMASAMALLSVAFCVAWTLLLVGYYLFAYRYLGRKHVVAYYHSSSGGSGSGDSGSSGASDPIAVGPAS